MRGCVQLRRTWELEPFSTSCSDHSTVKTPGPPKPWPSRPFTQPWDQQWGWRAAYTFPFSIPQIQSHMVMWYTHK